MIRNIKGFLKGKDLINSALWYTIGTFLLKGINFFTVPIFTRLLTTEDYGIIAIYSTWSGIISILIGIGIEGTIGSAKANLDKEQYDEYLSSTLFLSTISFSVILLLAILGNKYLVRLTDLNSKIIIIMIIQSFFSFVVSFTSSKYTFDRDYKNYLSVSFLVTILNIAISVLLILSLSNDKYLGKIYGGAISAILIGSILYIKIILKGKKLISLKYWKFCIPIAVPLIFHGLSHMVLNQSDRVMLQWFKNDEVVGVYSFTYNVGIIINIIQIAFNNAWVAWYFEALNGKLYKEIEDKAIKYIFIFTSITVAFMLGGPELIKILAPKSYWSGLNIFPLITLGYFFVFLYTFSVNFEFYKKKTTYIAFGTICAAIINILLNYILIPQLGGGGAALATALSYFMLFLLHEFIVRILMKHKEFSYRYFIYSILTILITVMLYYVFMDNMWVRWSIILIVLIYTIFNLYKLVKKNNF